MAMAFRLAIFITKFLSVAQIRYFKNYLSNSNCNPAFTLFWIEFHDSLFNVHFKMACSGRLSVSEKVVLVRLFSECEQNSLETVRRFKKLYPGRSVTSATVLSINRKFDEFGSVLSYDISSWKRQVQLSLKWSSLWLSLSLVGSNDCWWNVKACNWLKTNYRWSFFSYWLLQIIIFLLNTLAYHFKLQNWFENQNHFF